MEVGHVKASIDSALARIDTEKRIIPKVEKVLYVCMGCIKLRGKSDILFNHIKCICINAGLNKIAIFCFSPAWNKSRGDDGFFGIFPLIHYPNSVWGMS